MHYEYYIIVLVIHILTLHFYITNAALIGCNGVSVLLALHIFNSETLPPFGFMHRPPPYNFVFVCLFLLLHLSFMKKVELSWSFF